ncbi:metallophosphoesterase [Lusitaniella coriacea]|uniref:metallophosphoesterase n=1 Tax=Lusitaniella coriacea TaxID=1983105 RepID=UPI003CF8DCFA
MPAPLIVAQITDTHLFADPTQELYGIQTAQSLQAVLVHLQRLNPQPDLLLLTGDLSQDMTPKSYQQLSNYLAPFSFPIYWLPGNHDNPNIMRQIFNQGAIASSQSFSRENWHFLLLDLLHESRRVCQFKIENPSNQIQAQTKTFSAVTVAP